MQKTKNNYSTLERLKKEKKINDLFEIMLNNISLEDLLASKLESMTKIAGQPYYGLPIWGSISYIIKDALLKYALSTCSSRMKASRLLGISKKDFYTLIKRYGLINPTKSLGDKNEHNSNTGEIKKDL